MAHEFVLNPLHRQSGATLGAWRDWIVPLRFRNAAAEYDAVRQRAGLIDVSTLGVVEITGADRISFLHNLLTNDLKSVAPGFGCQAALVTSTAKLLAYVVVLADADRHWLITDRACVEALINTLNHYVITEDVAIHDRQTAYTILALQGPDVHSLTPPLGSTMSHRVLEIEGVAIRHIAHSLTGEPGVVLLAPTEQAAFVWDVWAKRVEPIGWEALNTRRIEAGIPWYGLDMDQTTLLPETGLREAISYTKGCYVGQEVIARLDSQGSLSRKLMGLRCEGSTNPQPGDTIHHEHQPAGTITSACWSPALKCPIALGYVKRPIYEAGTRVEILQGNQNIRATLTPRTELTRANSGRTR